MCSEVLRGQEASLLMLSKEGEERDENNLVKADGIPCILPQLFLRSEIITKSI